MSALNPTADSLAQPAISTARLTLILGALTAFAPFSIDMYLSGFQVIAQSLGSGVEQVQHSLAAFFLGVAVGQVIYGPAIDRFGRRTPMLIGISIYVVTSALLMFAPDIDTFISLRFIQALGACGGMVVARAMIRDLFDTRDAAIALSMMMAVVSLGPIVAPVLGSLILTWAQWPAIFGFLTVFGAICFVVAERNLPETLPVALRQKQNPWQVLKTFGALITRRRFMVPALTGGFAFSGVFAYVTAAPFVLMTRFELSQQAFGWLFALIACGLVLATYINRLLLKRSAPQKILVLGVSINAFAGLVLVSFHDTSSLVLLTAILALWISTMPLIGANAVAVAMSESGKFAGSASSIIGVSQFGLASLISALVGVMHDGTALPMSAIMFGCGIMAVLTLLIGPGKSIKAAEKM